MAHAINLVRGIGAERAAEHLRMVIVCLCACALIAAGNALPF